MTARRTTRKAATTDIVAEDLNLDSVVLPPETITIERAVEVATARKYMSHANCTHARTGEAGKLARAKCRKDIRAYLAAETEFFSTTDVPSDVAV